MMPVIIFILSACSFCVVLFMAQILSLFFYDEVFWFSLVVGAYLGIHAVGFGKGLRRPSVGRSAVIMPGLFFSAVVAAAIPVLYIFYFVSLYFSDQYGGLGGRGVFFVGLAGLIFMISWLSGRLLAELVGWSRETEYHQDSVAWPMRFQFLGYGAAGLLATLLPWVHRDVVLLGLGLGLSLLAVMWGLILLLGNQAVNQKRHITVASALMVFIVIVMIRAPLVGQYFLKKTYFVEPVHRLSDILRVKESWPDVIRHAVHNGYVDIVPFSPNPLYIWLLTSYSKKYLEDPAYPWGYLFFWNQQLIMNSQWDEFFQEYFVHVPVSLTGNVPRRVLVLGDTGLFLLKDIVKYTGIEKITVAGIDESVIALLEGEPVMRYSTVAGALQDPRIQLFFQEAFSFLKNNKDKFDAVYVHYPNAVDFATGQYYTREFFRLVADHITPEGYAVMASSAFLSSEKSGPLSRISWPVLRHTLLASGFQTLVPYAIDLEPDNPKAIEAVGAVLFGRQYFADPVCNPSETSCLPDAEKLKQAQTIVASFPASIKQGFLFMSKARRVPDTDVPFLQKDGLVPLRVLNELRFLRALGQARRISGEAATWDHAHSLLYPGLLRF